jgi:hypothetical protein
MSTASPDEFTLAFADAMRAGAPGSCRDPLTLQVRSWHPLERESHDALKASGTGGIAWCRDCGAALFVPGNNMRGIVIKGTMSELAKLFGPMKGVRL